jgi:hypothetical protein
MKKYVVPRERKKPHVLAWPDLMDPPLILWGLAAVIFENQLVSAVIADTRQAQ